MRLLDFGGKVLLDRTEAVQIPAQSSASYLTLGGKDLGFDPDRTFLAVDLSVGGSVVSRNELFFDKMRNLALPEKPAIHSSVAVRAGGYSVTLRSAMLARDVYLSFGDMDVTLADNYFDLIPGEPITVDLKTSATLEQLQQSLKIVSLTDAFFDQRASYRQHATQP